MARLALLVTTRATADRLGPYADGLLRVRVTRPPADGEANRAVLRLVADRLGVARHRVRIVSGQAARHKLLEIDGLSPAELMQRLAGLEEDPRS